MANSKEFKEMFESYRLKYEVDNLQQPNDLANLETMIRNQILVNKLQDRLDKMVETDNTLDPNEMKKILDSLVQLSQTNIQYERTLAIDRKTRKAQQEESVVDYITKLKQLAKEFVDNDRRILKVHCKNCNIMVGRISGVYDTTEYFASFQCPQCKKQIVVTRKERDIFFDVKDADWRRKYPMEVIQPKRMRRKDAPDLDAGSAELIIGDDDLGVEYGD